MLFLLSTMAVFPHNCRKDMCQKSRLSTELSTLFTYLIYFSLSLETTVAPDTSDTPDVPLTTVRSLQKGIFHREKCKTVLYIVEYKRLVTLSHAGQHAPAASVRVICARIRELTLFFFHGILMKVFLKIDGSPITGSADIRTD